MSELEPRSSIKPLGTAVDVQPSDQAASVFPSMCFVTAVDLGMSIQPGADIKLSI